MGRSEYLLIYRVQKETNNKINTSYYEISSSKRYLFLLRSCNVAIHDFRFLSFSHRHVSSLGLWETGAVAVILRYLRFEAVSDAETVMD